MNARKIGYGLLLSQLAAILAWGDVILCDLVGGSATDGYAPNSPTTYPISFEEAVGEFSDGGDVRSVGGGRYNIYINGVLEGYIIDLDEGGAAAVASSSQPAASSSIAVNNLIRRQIFTTAKPKARPKKKTQTVQPAKKEKQEAKAQSDPFYQQMPGVGRLNSGMADVFYNKWKIGGLDGATFGLNPSLTWGATSELTLTLPLHVIVPDEGDTLFATGLDGSFKHPFTGKWEMVSAGVHAYGLGYFGGEDTAKTFGGGPFLAWTYRVNEQWIFSAGALLELTKPEEGDTIVEIAPGVNIGYNVTDNTALNAYAIHYKNLDSDVEEDAYTDLGLDVQWVAGAWALAAGIKTATGMDSVDSTEFHLGSSWVF